MLRHKQAEELKVGIDINSLPLSAQIQVRAKLDEQKREQKQQRAKKQPEAQKRQKQPKEADSAEPSKYRNVKVFRVVDGETVKFPSKREARRFDELYLQYKGGAIQDLRLSRTSRWSRAIHGQMASGFAQWSIRQISYTFATVNASWKTRRENEPKSIS